MKTREVPWGLIAAIQPSGSLDLDGDTSNVLLSAWRWILHCLRQPDHRIDMLAALCMTIDDVDSIEQYASRIRAILAAAIEAVSQIGDQTDLAWSVTVDGDSLTIRWDGFATPGRFAALTFAHLNLSDTPSLTVRIAWDEGDRAPNQWDSETQCLVHVGWSSFLDLPRWFGTHLAHAVPVGTIQPASVETPAPLTMDDDWG